MCDRVGDIRPKGGYSPTRFALVEPSIPLVRARWYVVTMSGTYSIVMGDRGRIVVPVEVRERAGLSEGTPLVLIDAPEGCVLLTRAQLLRRVRADLAGLDLVGDLLAERRDASLREDGR